MNGELTYIKSLDSLRAIAAIMVVFFHSPMPAFNFQFGWAGVNLFFILSGFLITRILVSIKNESALTNFKNFYIRRILRIFPLYFSYLFVTVFLLWLLNSGIKLNDVYIKQGIADFKNNYPFLFTFTYNFEEVYNFLKGNSYENSFFFGHLWSLSVEEQFYFIFPIIVYLTPIAILKRLLVLTIICIPFLRLLFVNYLITKVNDLFWIGDLVYISTVFQLDALCLGACLALYGFKNILKYKHIILPGLLTITILIGVIHLVILNKYVNNFFSSSLGYDIPAYHLIYNLPFYILNNRYFYTIPLLNATFFLIILVIINQQKPFRLLENRLLRLIGRISFGVYVYHLSFSYLVTLFIGKVIKVHIDKLHWEVQFGLMFLYLGALLLSLASYNYLERKFLLLKSKFLYIN